MYHLRNNSRSSQGGTSIASGSPIPWTNSPVSHSEGIVGKAKNRTMPGRKNFFNPKSLSERSGIMKARALDMQDTTNKGTDDMTEIRQNGTGGLVFRQGCSVEERQTISRAKAAKLSAEYELSETADPALNRKAVIPKVGSFTTFIANRRASIKRATSFSDPDEEVPQIQPARSFKGEELNVNQFDDAIQLPQRTKNNPRTSRASQESHLDTRDEENRVPSAIEGEVKAKQSILSREGLNNFARRHSKSTQQQLQIPTNQLPMGELPDLC